MNSELFPIIEERVRAAAQTKPSGIRRLKKAVRRWLRDLRTAYDSLPAAPDEAWAQWLSDNFYTLEGHAKQILRDLPGFKGCGTACMRLYAAVERVFMDGRVVPDQAHVGQTLLFAGLLGELGERQFDFLYTALRCALLRAAADACAEQTAQQERERLISYAVVELNRICELDFDALVSECSAVEAILAKDPSGVYPRMAEQSRSHYRHVAARIAKRCGMAESAVAQDVLNCAEIAKGERERHVGFYLLNHDPRSIHARRRAIAALTLTWLAPVLLCVLIWGVFHSLTAALVSYLPLVEIVRVITCGLAARHASPAHIPRMELRGDAPETIVAVSTLLPAAAKADELRERLEQLYFSNRGDHLKFCVLADFKEDRRPYNPQDELNMAAAKRVVEQLNEKYGSRFALLVRRRVFSSTQNAYIGWERKRGAIIELIRFLRGGDPAIACFAGDREQLSRARYLLALDADTLLAFDSADRLLSAAVHPLNRPVIGKHNIVTAGYGILVPRIGTDLNSAKAADFTRIMAGAGGVSTYEQECSDFYQDHFGESIFTGKGLIDIETFHTVVGRRFPENRVLSHDILEGAYLRAGLLSDVEMTDGMPANALSWLARLHRWIRGDWQNLCFFGRTIQLNGSSRPNPISALSRYQLFDNLRRSFVPVAALICVLVSAFTGWRAAILLCLLAFLSTALAPLLAAFRALLYGGRFALSRRFFACTLPRVFELCGQALLSVVMTAQQAVVAFDAIVRTLWRIFVSHKRLLQWTTAAQSETRDTGFFAVLKKSWLSELVGLCLLIFAPASHGLVKLYGLLFLLYTPAAAATARPAVQRLQAPDQSGRERLLSLCAQMFRYYEDYADKHNRWLPPDNVQFSPVEAVARRTSPTNIGMMLLSYLAARDFHFIDSRGLYVRLNHVFDTIETLQTWHGNLYNWYSTEDLHVLPEPFVSAVDSGNYLCALVALKEGVREYAAQEPGLETIAGRIEAILKNTDFSVFYNPKRRLLSIGAGADGRLVSSHYDFLMSEARTASYFAVATRQAQYRHWRALNRTMSRCGSYAGPVSWTGTMFEYFMPHLLLPIYEDSLLDESLHYALYCQKRRARRAGVPWGISESGYFAFDEQLNYQYKAHGVQTLGVKQGLDRECVVAPYATFLTLPFDFDGAMKNLEALESLGLTGRYGFYEAVDFTPGRAAPSDGGYAVVRSYMAHHVGMSMVACANALLGGIMQKRFMRDHAMRAAREFLQEQISKDTVVYDRMKDETELCRAETPVRAVSARDGVSPLAPRCALLASGELTHIFSDTGTSWLRFGDCDATRRPSDPLLNGQGVLAAVKLCGQTLTAAAAPFYQNGVERRSEFGPDFVAYHADQGDIGLTQRFSIDRTAPVERCELIVRNRTALKAVAQVLIYFEPVLARDSDYAAHPAFSKLFVTGERDPAADAVVFVRRHREGGEGPCLCAGFAGREAFECGLRREDMTPYPDGLENLLQFDALPFNGGGATPDGCCALRATMTVPAHGEQRITLLISCAAAREDALDALAGAREKKRAAAPAPLADDTMEARLAARLLPCLLLRASGGDSRALLENTRGQDALWSMGISGDRPIVLFDWNAYPDGARLAAYTRLWTLMRMYRLDFDLCVLGTPAAKTPDGVHVLLPERFDPSAVLLLRAAACHIAGQPEPPAPPEWEPAPVLHTDPAPILQAKERLDVVGGAYVNGRFYVSRVTPLPFSHILANRTFGCLLNDASLGNTWWLNAHECRLTPWKNDIATGCDGEKLWLSASGALYDLIRGARASFSPEDALYEGSAGKILTAVRVFVPAQGNAKVIDVSLENQTDEEAEVICAYGLEPVLGVTRLNAKYTQFDQEQGCLLMHNPYHMALPCHAAVYAPHEYPSYTTDRAAFLAGDWSARELLPNNDPIAGLIIRKKLPARRRADIRLILAAGATRAEAVAEALRQQSAPDVGMERPVEIATPCAPLDRFINTFAVHQIRSGRLFGRCAFYQCSGAYGFRDQLQDACALRLTEPALLREQILRCCAVQFAEGDVLHWWHPLPTETRGVRTRFSDDLVWLPYAVCAYVEATGDKTLLDEQVPFCTGGALASGEQEQYMQVQASETRAPVFEHCVRALEKAYNLGDRGIPKIGCGDWNDGFSKVGARGEGQSVWLAMFLSIVCDRFAALCDSRDAQRADALRAHAALLRRNVDVSCWDGQWYLRAFYDDGAPLGGHGNDECSIDLLAQSFAVFAGMPDQARVSSALDAALAHLVDDRCGIIRLFDPPFADTKQNPGYIKAYPRGIRENGGQYTHASVWFAQAMLESGRIRDGWRLIDLLNPTARCTDAARAQAFKTEPYYMPADIYTNKDAYGHGGWSIYTGAAAWYLRTVLETLLGLRPKDGALTFEPHVPDDWTHFTVKLRRENAVLSIEVNRTGMRSLTVDGAPAQSAPLDGRDHTILLTI